MRSDLNFNSIKVQLRLKPADDQHFEDQDFNSIKVQLRPFWYRAFVLSFMGISIP